ncbi:MAG: HAD family phosphatase [Spirochaetaceae bacterium]|nr:MAG: HAD family phosphatase [Spirochaetaceae bacterium]
MSYKLIVSDVDGCISPEESVGWDHHAFHELAERVRGKAFTICTGRPQPYVEVLLKLLDVGLPAICENGAVFYDLEHNAPTLAPGVTPDAIAALRTIRAHIERSILPGRAGAAIQYGKEAQISVFSADPALIDPMADQVRAFVDSTRFSEGARFGEGARFQIDSSHYYLNISIAGVSKGSALSALLKTLKVEPSECAVIGDTSGDLPMRDHAGFFGCPANATEAVQGVADYVSPDRDIRGLLDILSRID